MLPIPKTGATNIDALLSTYRWESPVISYSFAEGGSQFSTAVGAGYGSTQSGNEPWTRYFSPLSSSDRPFFAGALAKWSNVAALSFVQVAESSTNVGTIRAAYTYLPSKSETTAWAYLPSATPNGGDIWFNALGSAGKDVWTQGSFANFSVVHELGHALGLKHPFEGGVVLPSQYDSQIYTVMSYSASPGLSLATVLDYYPTTPMVLDIAAIQYVYGANTSFHAGDDTYVYNDTGKYMETIWDAAGRDTIRYDGVQDSFINLNPGYGSTIGNRVHILSNTALPQIVNNVWIAFGVQLENATGGAGNDQITGNDGDNLLSGRGGNDLLDGKAGDDSALYSGRIGQFKVVRNASGYLVTDKTGVEGSDQLSNIEHLRFTDKTVNLAVAAQAKTINAATLKSLVELYVAFFNRVPDGDGMSYWISQAAAGASIPSIANNFYSAAVQFSSVTGYSATMTNTAFVNLIYKNVLGRATADADGLAYWTNALARGTETRGTLVQSILASAHTFKGRADFGAVADLLDNKYTVGKLFAVDMGLGFLTSEESITKGMQIAAAVTSASTAAAISLIGVSAADVQL